MDKILNIINNPKDLKKLNIDDLYKLSDIIRRKIIKTTSVNGGHLASNLGAVELTLALHYVLNAPEDKIIWDVGHQSYTHKIITGRWSKFDTIRKTNGISGFPKREESIYDTFNTGHSSTSLSAALGMANARDIKNKNYKVAAVIGDGALTGGMAFEALNNAGRYKKNLIFVLNDNEMSISKNVGGLSKYLSKIRTTDSYIKTDNSIKKIMQKIPYLGKYMISAIRKLKNTLKYVVMPGILFEEMGFKYIGPIDGHNIKDLIKTLQTVVDINGPVILHVITKKGKGYEFAEQKPGDYHSVSPYNIKTGQGKKKKILTFSDIFSTKVINMAENSPKLVTVSAAMSKGTCLDVFEKKFPNRFFDVGIAEQHAVTFAAGMATRGLTPVVAIYSTFLQRAYDQVLHDVALQNLHVIFAIDRAGLAQGDGETHHGIYDVSFLMHIPNMTLLAAADYNDLENMLQYAVDEENGPIAIRYPKGMGKRIAVNSSKIKKGCGTVYQDDDNADVCIVALGTCLDSGLNIKKSLKRQNIKVKVINPRFLKPINYHFYKNNVMDCNAVVIIEETIETGGFSEYLSINLSKWGYSGKIRSYSLDNDIIPAGNKKHLIGKYGWTENKILNDLTRMVNQRKTIKIPK